VEYLTGNEYFGKKEYENALIQAFLKLDEYMGTKEGQAQLTAARL